MVALHPIRLRINSPPHLGNLLAPSRCPVQTSWRLLWTPAFIKAPFPWLTLSVRFWWLSCPWASCPYSSPLIPTPAVHFLAWISCFHSAWVLKLGSLKRPPLHHCPSSWKPHVPFILYWESPDTMHALYSVFPPHGHLVPSSTRGDGLVMPAGSFSRMAEALSFPFAMAWPWTWYSQL